MRGPTILRSRMALRSPTSIYSNDPTSRTVVNPAINVFRAYSVASSVNSGTVLRRRSSRSCFQSSEACWDKWVCVHESRQQGGVPKVDHFGPGRRCRSHAGALDPAGHYDDQSRRGHTVRLAVKHPAGLENHWTGRQGRLPDAECQQKACHKTHGHYSNTAVCVGYQVRFLPQYRLAARLPKNSLRKR